MAIDHLEGFCKYKKLQFNRTEQISGLNYDAINMINSQVDKKRKEDFEKISGNHFDSYGDRTEYALSQIFIIAKYLNDFSTIEANLKQEATNLKKNSSTTFAQKSVKDPAKAEGEETGMPAEKE